MSKRYKHGDVIWINLLPFINKRVVAKVIDYREYLNLRAENYFPSVFGLIVYNNFYDELEFDFSMMLQNENLINPVHSLFGFYQIDYKTKKVTSVEIPIEEVAFPDITHFSYNAFSEFFRPPITEFTCTPNIDPLISAITEYTNYKVYSKSRDVNEYVLKGEYDYNDCRHLEFDINRGMGDVIIKIEQELVKQKAEINKNAEIALLSFERSNFLHRLNRDTPSYSDLTFELKHKIQ